MIGATPLLMETVMVPDGMQPEGVAAMVPASGAGAATVAVRVMLQPAASFTTTLCTPAGTPVNAPTACGVPPSRANVKGPKPAPAFTVAVTVPLGGVQPEGVAVAVPARAGYVVVV